MGKIKKLKSEKYKGMTIYFEKDVKDGWTFGGAGKVNKNDGKYEFYKEASTKSVVLESIKKQIDKKIPSKRVRPEIKKYMEENKSGLSESHLDGWFKREYEGNTKRQIEDNLYINHDNSLLVEELEEKFGKISDEEDSYATDIFNKEVMKNLRYKNGVAYDYVNTTGMLNSEWQNQHGINR
jgi:hypothetical protein